ncbi:MAG: HAD-IA family hydrolase [SAR202 cluster bacterium]|nr:HAD-IA family hydrolase [SAR202 cluster bacterium]
MLSGQRPSPARGEGTDAQWYHGAMIKTVFFDLYGTLAGFQPTRFEIQSRAAADFGLTLTPQGVLRGYALADAYMAKQNTMKPLRAMTDGERHEFFSEYERLVLSGSGVEVTNEKAGEVWRRVRKEEYGLAPFDDVKPTLTALRERGLTLGLISNMGRRGGDLTRELGLDTFLDFAVTSLEAGAEKPDPRIFHAALDRAGVPPEQAVHVGDQLHSDIDGARGVGIHPVLLDRDGNHPGFTDCPRIESLTELTEVVHARL